MNRRALLSSICGVATAANAGCLDRLSVGSGAPVQSRRLDWQRLEVVDDDQRIETTNEILVVATSTRVAAYDPKTGSTLWSVDLNTGAGRAVPPAPEIAVDDAVYLYGHDGTLYALDPADGTELWRFDVGGAPGAVLAQDAAVDVVARSVDGRLLGVEAGTEAWARRVRSGTSKPIPVNDGDLAVAAQLADGASADLALHVLNSADGASRWSAQPDDLTQWYVGAFEEETALVRFAGGGVAAVRDGDGVAWRREGPSGETSEAFWTTTILGGQVVVGTQTWPATVDAYESAPRGHQHFRSLDPDDGRVRSNVTRTIADEMASSSPFHYGEANATEIDDVLYVGGMWSVIAFDATTGDVWRLPGWRHPLELASVGDSLVLGAREHLLALTPTDACSAGEIVGTHAEYVNLPRRPEQLRTEFTVTPGACPTLLGIEAVWNGEVWVADSVLVADGPTDADYVLRPEASTQRFLRYVSYVPDDVGEITLRLRGAGGRIMTETSVSVDDFRHAPASFSIRCAELERRPVEGGTVVTAAFDVQNTGGNPRYEARLLADDQVLAATRGREFEDGVEPPPACPVSSVELTGTIETAGTYDVKADVRAKNGPGDGESVDLGTVTVGGSTGTLSVRPGTVVAGIGGGLLALRRGDGESGK